MLRLESQEVKYYDNYSFGFGQELDSYWNKISMARHAYNIIKCIKRMQKFTKYDSYFWATNKRKELLLLEGAVDKKSQYTKATQINR